jgi:hypothetical protein
MSIIKLPGWAIKMINSQKRYHLANWQLIAQKKDHGGLGIPDLRTLNLCLLAT